MIEIETLSMIRGSIPARDCRVVMEWAIANQAGIAAVWNALNPNLTI